MFFLINHWNNKSSKNSNGCRFVLRLKMLWNSSFEFIAPDFWQKGDIIVFSDKK